MNNQKIGKSKKMSRSIGNKLNIVLEEQTVSMVRHATAAQKDMHVKDHTFHQYTHVDMKYSQNACMSSVSSGSPRSNSGTSAIRNVWQQVSNGNKPNVNNSSPKSTHASSPTITKWKCTSSTFANYIVESNSFYSVSEKKRIITEKEILGVLHLSQQKACKQLNCSLSTLKRRFYELKEGFGLERWPQYFFEIRHLPIFKKIYPMNLEFILNSDEK